MGQVDFLGSCVGSVDVFFRGVLFLASQGLGSWAINFHIFCFLLFSIELYFFLIL